MIKYGLKIWNNNTEWFEEAKKLYNNKNIDFIEIYFNPDSETNYSHFDVFKDIPVNIHCTHTNNFHEFSLGEKELKIWNQVVKLADFFKSKHIVVHTGRNHDIESFKKELQKIEDNRILLENMPGLDIFGKEMSFYNLESLKKLRQIKEICFDFEKAFKSALYQKVRYEDFVTKCLDELKPEYFHISGGKTNNPVDEHLNLWEADFDIKWIKQELENRFFDNDCCLLFETPKEGKGLENDLKNIEYFKNL